MTDLLSELEWRGFVQQRTPGCDAHLAEPRTLYCGFDPTAPSLQLGNLMPLFLLRHFQRHGHTPIVLMGGGTGLIGDPSGKRGERPLLDKQQLKDHLHHQRDQMARFLDFDPGPASALLLDNAKWLVELKLVDFLRDIGKHFTVNVMLQKESVQARLDAGISYTEFSYMLLQGFDFLHLYRTKRCTLQVGGSDQWGNITLGADLIRKIEGGEAHALVAPLVTSASGAKFGKTEEGTVWLDPAMTSPYKFYQFWVNVDDRDAEKYAKLFSLKPRQEIDALVAEGRKNPAERAPQRALGREITELVHGGDAAANAVTASEILFGEFDPHRAEPTVFDVLAAEIPTTAAPAADGLTIVDALTQSGLVKSKGEAKRALEQGGVYVNQKREPADRALARGDWLSGRNVLLRKGKKDFALLRAGA
ncbi:MAG TPA: tyrosine--tRNA ligase [Gemmatimonadales bacterium]|nr:tyrosine--tRNA ligase [Gemmatimonadales bacterium]